LIGLRLLLSHQLGLVRACGPTRAVLVVMRWAVDQLVFLLRLLGVSWELILGRDFKWL
jgi:hypothetical protein